MQPLSDNTSEKEMPEPGNIDTYEMPEVVLGLVADSSSNRVTSMPPFEAGTVFEVATVGDIIGVGAFVAGNLNAEQLAHRRHMVVERAFRVVLAAGKQVVAHPLAADIAERDSLESHLVHRIYQPNILSY